MKILLLLGFGLTLTTFAPPQEPVAKAKTTYCAFFTADGNHKESYCTSAPLAEAQKQCDAKLKARKIEGTCSCTDDASFIGDRCG